MSLVLPQRLYSEGPLSVQERGSSSHSLPPSDAPPAILPMSIVLPQRLYSEGLPSVQQVAFPSQAGPGQRGTSGTDPLALHPGHLASCWVRLALRTPLPPHISPREITAILPQQREAIQRSKTQHYSSEPSTSSALRFLPNSAVLLSNAHSVKPNIAERNLL